MNRSVCDFFLAATTCDGFVSFFGDLPREADRRDVYMIKSGPGCGKSTLMARLAERLAPEGVCEYIHCASDPQSLDGVIMHEKNIAVIDGTAPHITEPGFPGANGGYICFPPFKDVAGFRTQYSALLALGDAMKYHFSLMQSFITSAGKTDAQMREILKPYFFAEKFKKRTIGIVLREMPAKGTFGKSFPRFIDGITPQGRIRYYNTVSALAKKVYNISDTYGFGYLLLDELKQNAISRGYDVYVCLNPTDLRILHLIIPELSLAFVTSDRFAQFEGEAHRNIHADNYLDREALKTEKRRLKVFSRIFEASLTSAVAEMRAAKNLHDKVEDIYRDHVDFAAIDAMLPRLEVTL